MVEFVENHEILGLLETVKQKGLDRKIYSDIIDQSGNQYVDLVQEGGGVLGIALTGYTWILEKCGIRFFSLAGSSAGAVNTIMIAGLAPVGETVSGRIVEILSRQNLADFMDGDSRIGKLIRRYIEDRPCFKLHVFLNSLRIWRILRRHLGINPGMEFEKWLSGCLGDAGIHSLADLRQLRSRVPVLMDRSADNAEITRVADLKIIVSDITTKSKIIFPEMAELYWQDPDSVNPARFVRASMSIPWFFYPLVIDKIPNAGKTENHNLPKNRTKWRKHAGYRGKIPERVFFVDGGMLSNFPVNAFHIKSGVPKKPTFGVKLSTWRDGYTSTETPGSMAKAMISTMRQLHDYDFLLNNPDYNSLICHIDADSEFNWLDFNMPDDQQLDLFMLGAEKAVNFLERFDWEAYKAIRKKHLIS